MLQRSFIRRSRFVAAIVLASAVLSTVRAAEPEILQQIPGDAYGVVVVSSVKGLANKISNAATRLQVAVPTDLVGNITAGVGITQGFDPNGSVALVLLKPGPDRAGRSYFADIPPVVLLLPTTNSAILLEKFNPTAPDKDGISQVALPNSPDEKGFVAVVEKKWVALAQKKEDLASYVARANAFTKTVSADTLKAFEANDVVFWGNVEKLGAGADNWLADQQADLIGKNDLTVFVDNQDPLTAVTEKAGIRAVFDLARRFFKDAGAGMVSLRLSDSGVTLGMVADFKADSPMGKFMAAQPAKAEAVALKGLPAGNFLAAGAGQWNTPMLSNTVGEFLGQIAADPSRAKSPRLAELRQSIDDVRQALGLVGGARFTMLEPPAQGKDGYFSGAILVETSDAKKLVDLELKMAGNKLAQDSMSPDIKTTVAVTPNALTVKDVPLAKVSVKYSLRDEAPDKPVTNASKGQFEILQKLYGAGGMTVYMGAVGKRMLMVYGSDANLIESAVSAAQTDSDALAASADIAASKSELVANPLGVVYLPVARWVKLAQGILLPEGEAQTAPGAGAAGAPPVVLSMGVAGTVVTVEAHVPIATILATQEAIQRLERGGGGDGGVVPGLP
jgi:hypothetical protein